MGFKPPVETVVLPFVNPMDFGAIADGTTHPLSESFGTLAAAQAVYPHTTALTQTFDWAAIQAAINAVQARGGVVQLPPRHFVLGNGGTLTCPRPVVIRGSGKGQAKQADGGSYAQRSTLLDATHTHFRTNVAILSDPAKAGNTNGLVVEHLNLKGPSPEVCTTGTGALETGSSVGIYLGYYGGGAVISSVLVNGFGTHVMVRNGSNIVIKDSIFKQAGAHCIRGYCEAGDNGTNLSITDCLVSDAGTGPSPAANKRAANISIENFQGVSVKGGLVDEAFGGMPSIGVWGNSRDITVDVPLIFSHGKSGDPVGPCVQIGDGTALSDPGNVYPPPAGNVQKRVRIKGHLSPYNYETGQTNTNKAIVINPSAVDTMLDITLDPTFPADPITDNGIRTTFASRADAGRASRYARAVLTDNPIAYWRLGEDVGTSARDAQGTAHGIYKGGPALGAAGATLSDADKAVTFNGSSQYVEVPDSNHLDIGDNFTAEFWIKRTGLTGGAKWTVLSKGNNSFLVAIDGDDKLYLEKQAVAGIVVSTVIVPNDGASHLCAVTKAGSTVKLYIDGVDRTGTVTNSTLADTTDNLNIARRTSANDYCPGTLDEVAIYGYALSAARVLAHFNAR